jgi:hypothetical protein
MWNAVRNGWAHPQQYAVCVRDHPISVFQEIERLLIAIRYALRANLPAKTAAKTASL